MEGKILYDDTIRTKEEWDKSLFDLAKGFSDIRLPDEGNLPDLQIVQSHYFAILHNNHLKIMSKIRNQVKSKLGIWTPIVWDFSHSEGNAEFYRIDTPRGLAVYRKEIYGPQNRWKRDETLHSKGPEAIRNLIGRMNSGDI